MGVRWGILSTALINDLVVAGVRGSDEAELVAIASRDAGRARAAADRYGMPRSFGDYDALLAHPDVDAVYIPLPNGQHVDWTLRALAAGKHVLVEKPFGRRADEVRAACDEAGRRGLVLTEAFMWRYTPQTERLLELVADGSIGDPVIVRSAFSFDLAEVRGTGDTRFDPALDGGALMDIGCYCVSASRLLAGEPVRVAAEQIVGPSGVDVALSATMRSGSGVLSHFDCSFISPQRMQIEVVGTTGTLVLGDPWHARAPGIDLRSGDRVERVAVPVADAYRCQFDHVSRAIAGREQLRYGTADAVAQATVIQALYASADTGRSVTL